MDSFTNVLQTLWETVLSRLPAVIWAIVVLFVGWIVARIVSRVTTRIVRHLTQSAQVQEEQERYRVDEVAGRVAFWVVMVFVLVEFFEVLGVTAVTGPFLSVANEFALAVPNLVKTVLILLSAWVLATLLRRLSIRALSSNTATRVLDELDVIDGESDKAALVKTAGNVVYYLVLLMFLPAVFSALQLEGLQGPLEQVVAQGLGFLPRLIAATVTVAVGYVLARIVRSITSAFLASVGADALPAKVGMEQVFQNVPLSRSLGTIAFVLVFLPILISGLESLGVEAISGPAISMLTLVLNMVPSIAVAVLLFAAGLALARWVGRFTTTLLENINAARFLVKWGLLRDEKTEPSVESIVGKVVTGILMLLVLIEVFDVLRLSELSFVLLSILAYVPRAVLAVAILATGFAVGRFLRRTLQPVLERSAYPVWLSGLAQYAVVVLASMMALEQLGVARVIVVNGFSILLGSLGLAAAIAVGLGSKDWVARKLERTWPTAAPGESKRSDDLTA